MANLDVPGKQQLSNFFLIFVDVHTTGATQVVEGQNYLGSCCRALSLSVLHQERSVHLWLECWAARYGLSNSVHSTLNYIIYDI